MPATPRRCGRRARPPSLRGPRSAHMSRIATATASGDATCRSTLRRSPRMPPSRSRRCTRQRRPPAAGSHTSSRTALSTTARAAIGSARPPWWGLPLPRGRDRSPWSASPAQRSSRARMRPGCSPFPRDSPTGPTPRTGRWCRAPSRARRWGRGRRAPGPRPRGRPFRRRGAVDLRSQRHRRRRRAHRAGPRNARHGRGRTAGIRMTTSIRRAGDRGALVELSDSAAAVRVARALAGRPEFVDVVPGHRTVLVTWARGAQPRVLDSLVDSALATDVGTRAGPHASRFRSSTTGRISRRSRGS